MLDVNSDISQENTPRIDAKEKDIQSAILDYLARCIAIAWASRFTSGRLGLRIEQAIECKRPRGGVVGRLMRVLCLFLLKWNGNMKMSNEQQIEQEIQALGLNAPRLTPEHLDSVIASEDYHVFTGTTLTVCALRLCNGFVITGESAAASPENFDAEIGKKIARQNAREKIWMLEGYLLKQKLFEAK